MPKIVIDVCDEYDNPRIDKFLSESYPEFSRSYLKKLTDDGKLMVNGKICKPGYRIKSEDTIILDVPENIKPDVSAEAIPLDILYEDNDIIVVNKPKGMVVHPAAGHYSGTLVNALMYHCSDLSGINGILRPGIVHRIDKDTSGVLVCCKNDNSHKNLAEQLKFHDITRVYECIAVGGSFKESSGTINKPIGRSKNNRKMMSVNAINAKSAVTNYKVLQYFANSCCSHVECKLKTGRTHQIRVHMASIHHPLLGDSVYGGKITSYKLDGYPLEGQALHAKLLGFKHPSTGEYMEFSASRPKYFDRLLEVL